MCFRHWQVALHQGLHVIFNGCQINNCKCKFSVFPKSQGAQMSPSSFNMRKSLLQLCFWPCTIIVSCRNGHTLIQRQVAGSQGGTFPSFCGLCTEGSRKHIKKFGNSQRRWINLSSVTQRIRGRCQAPVGLGCQCSFSPTKQI